jgi:hypothetical protein
MLWSFWERIWLPKILDPDSGLDCENGSLKKQPNKWSPKRIQKDYKEKGHINRSCCVDAHLTDVFNHGKN